jgi:hypothetical protein
MTPEPYRVAYESALAEITEIAAKFEQLQQRKSQIENLIAVLQPMFAAEGNISHAAPPAVARDTMAEENSGTQAVSEMDAAGSEDPASYSYLDVPNPLPAGDGDAFQRRVRSNFRFRGLAAQRSF